MRVGVIAAALLSASGAIADPSEDCAAAFNGQDYAAAVQLCLPVAEQGDARVQNNLGYMYYNGRGAPQDYVEAMKWFRRAADQGVAQAQTSLGFMYTNGQGVPQDYAEAVQWSRQAAEQGVD